MRIQYHIEGSKRKGLVIVDIKKTKKGSKYRFEPRFGFVKTLVSDF